MYTNTIFSILAKLLPLAALGLWALVTSLCLIGTVVVLKKYSHSKPSYSATIDPSLAPPVSILRPLKGVDCNLKENLESSFNLNYPVFELIFSVADADDPAIQVVHRLTKEYPNVDAKLIIGDLNIGVNPKVNNLIKGYNSSKYDIIWILDSNIYVGPECLGRSIDELCKPNVGLVHHLPCGMKPNSFGSHLEMAFLNTAHSRMYVAINTVAVASCVVGKSNLLRKSQLNKNGGGLYQFSKFMSEDNVIGQTLWNQKLAHRITSDIVYQPLGSLTITDYLKRRSRWIRIRKYANPLATILEAASESIANSILGAYVFNHFFQISPISFFILQMLLWFTADTIVFWTVQSKFTPRSIFMFIISWLVREITAIHVYMYAIAGSSIEWRGKLYRLNRDGTVVLSKSKPLKTWNDSLDRIFPKYWISSPKFNRVDVNKDS